ncbi:MAG: hypothetical protein E7649_06865 [Ruminococcaceae bacterium]|nr:hypothetical protein [Oscillospiraceae bacterium]
MSDLLIKIFGIAILGALFSVILRKWSMDVAVLFKVAVGVVLCIASITMLAPLMDRIREIGAAVDMSEEVSDCITALMRALCVAIISHVCATVCRDCGENGIAYYAELGGKIEIMLISLPLFLEVLETALEMMRLGE